MKFLVSSVCSLISYLFDSARSFSSARFCYINIIERLRSFGYEIELPGDAVGSLEKLTQSLKADTVYGIQNGCKPPTFVLAYKWPLALDLVKRGFREGRQKKLLALFTDYFEQLGPTAELTVLGGTGYATKDPENIEAILSTKFDGTLLINVFWKVSISTWL